MRSAALVGLLILLIVLFAGCGQPEPVAIVPPTIHDVQVGQFQQSGVTVRWQTDSPTSSRIDYNTATDPQITVADNALRTVHSLQASFLTTPQASTLTISSTDERGFTAQYTVILPRNSPIFNP